MIGMIRRSGATPKDPEGVELVSAEVLACCDMQQYGSTGSSGSNDQRREEIEAREN